MLYLENLNPNYLDILEPLKDWKILSTEDLKNLSEYPCGKSSFYKAIKRLESAKLIKGFADSFTNQRFLYLLEDGFKSLGLERMIPIHEENRYHDAHLVRLLLKFKMIPYFENFLLDHKIKKEFPLLSHTPDAVITGKKKEKFHLALELELTQKSKERIREAFLFYEASPYFNNVIYFFNRLTPYKTYQEVLKNTIEIKQKDRFILIYEPQLTRRIYAPMNSEVTFKQKQTTLKEIFSL